MQLNTSLTKPQKQKFWKTQIVMLIYFPVSNITS